MIYSRDDSIQDDGWAQGYNDVQARRLRKGRTIMGAGDRTPQLKRGSWNVDFDSCAGLSGIVAIVKPMRSEYPKCIEGFAANLLVYRLSIHIEPSTPVPWTDVSLLEDSQKLGNKYTHNF